MDDGQLMSTIDIILMSIQHFCVNSVIFQLAHAISCEQSIPELCHSDVHDLKFVDKGSNRNCATSLDNFIYLLFFSNILFKENT